MSQFYISITFLLLMILLKCHAEITTEEVKDKNNGQRNGTLLRIDECFNLFVKDGLIFYKGEKVLFKNFKAKNGSCPITKDFVNIDNKSVAKTMEASITFSVNIDKIENLKEIEFTMKTLKDVQKEYWMISEIWVTGLNKKVRLEVDSLLEAPKSFSYHCDNLELYKSHKNEKDEDEKSFVNLLNKIVLRDFQIQPFKDKLFNESFDCSTWFTIGTFSGLIILILFTIILALGICYIMSIKTNDRYENPKGKPLVIGNVDN